MCVCVCVWPRKAEPEPSNPGHVFIFLLGHPRAWGSASWGLLALERGPASDQSSPAHHPLRLRSTSQHLPVLSPDFPLPSSSVVSRMSKECTSPKLGHTSTKMEKKKKNQIALSVCKGELPPGMCGGVPDQFCDYTVLHLGEG